MTIIIKITKYYNEFLNKHYVIHVIHHRRPKKQAKILKILFASVYFEMIRKFEGY